MFAERLNQIMELTHTRVSELAKASNLNASHVSRLKNGTRQLPKRPDFLPAMSAYLARLVSGPAYRGIRNTAKQIAEVVLPLLERSTA